MLTNLTERTPVEIDTDLYRLDGEIARADHTVSHKIEAVHREARDTRVGDDWRGPWKLPLGACLDTLRDMSEGEGYRASNAQRVLDDFNAASKAAADLEAEANVLHEEYDRRPWTRAWLVLTSGTGHVHRSTFCPTCNKMGKATAFARLAELSGADEDEIVRRAGEGACTVCYASAPVLHLDRPRTVFSPEEKAEQAAREERQRQAEARKAAKLAKAATVDGSPLLVVTVDSRWPEKFATAQAAMTWATDRWSWGAEVRDAAGIRQVAEALAVKRTSLGTATTLDQVVAEITRKGEAKARKAGRR